jgi:hypothetical protein
MPIKSREGGTERFREMAKIEIIAKRRRIGNSVTPFPATGF